MKTLKKRYDKSLKSVRAQKACPCSAAACTGCLSPEYQPSSQTQYNKFYPQHKSGQYKLY